jgi:hypothetical protein
MVDQADLLVCSKLHMLVCWHAFCTPGGIIMTHDDDHDWQQLPRRAACVFEPLTECLYP